MRRNCGLPRRLGGVNHHRESLFRLHSDRADQSAERSCSSPVHANHFSRVLGVNGDRECRVFALPLRFDYDVVWKVNHRTDRAKEQPIDREDARVGHRTCYPDCRFNGGPAYQSESNGPLGTGFSASVCSAKWRLRLGSSRAIIPSANVTRTFPLKKVTSTILGVSARSGLRNEHPSFG
jgi:hypothetical protein